MKRLLTFLLFIQLTVNAQDSTSISFSTETVNEFRKQRLMDEYERAFGGIKSVNTRLKTGFMDLYGANFPFIGIEQRIGQRFNLGIGAIVSTNSIQRNYHFGRFMKEPNSVISPYAELKYYFKPNNKLSGNYIGIEYKGISETSNLNFIGWTNNAPPYFSKNQFSINLGKQFGSSVDIGLQIGLKNVSKSEVDQEGFLYVNKNPDNPFVLFAGTYSKVGIGKDFPKSKSKNNESCDFLNCYTEFKSLFKINLSNSLYADPFYKNIKLDLAYERKLGQLPLSLNFALVSGVYTIKSFKLSGESGTKTIGDWTGNFPKYTRESRNSTTISSTATLQLRYYIFQNRNIARGKAVSNLSGFYTGLYSYRELAFSNAYSLDGKFMKVSQNGFLGNTGVMLGIQKKILKNYYYDFSTQIPFKSNLKGENLLMPNIRFGYAF